METAMVFSPNMPADTRACAPAQGSVLESAKMLLRYIDKNPDRLSEAGITVAIEALERCLAVRGRRCHSAGQIRPQTKKARAEKTSQ